jgi:hypothetical protein
MKIISRIIIIILPIALTLIFSCGKKVINTSSAYSSDVANQGWSNQPTLKTTKIRLTTKLKERELQRLFLTRFTRHRFKIDTSSSLDPMKTSINRLDNYYVQYYVNIRDSVVIISGRAGNLGLNAVLGGHEPAEHNIIWAVISLNGKGWEFMNAISTLKDADKKYN